MLISKWILQLVASVYILLLSTCYAFRGPTHFHAKVVSSSNSLKLSASEPSIDSADPFEQLQQKLRGTCVYFIGMMGSGKSTTGKIFAEKLGYRFLDTDEIAEFMVSTCLHISESFQKHNLKTAVFAILLAD